MAGAVGEQLLAVSPECSVRQVDICGRDDAAIGFVESLEGFRYGRLDLGRAFRAIVEEEPDVAVFVGYPDFHLLLGPRLRRVGVRVYWVGPPQFWAWGRFRLSLLRRGADKVACLFCFELKPLQRAGIVAAYHGYPLYDSVRATEMRPNVLARLGLEPEARYIAFMPGSREAEKRFHVPLYCRTFTRLRQAEPGLRGVMICPQSGSLPEGMLAMADGRYDVLRHAEMAVIASGTATAEAALLGVPHVVTYHLSPVSRLLARLLVRLGHFALPNIIAGRLVVPEFLEPDEVTLARGCLAIVRSAAERERIRAGLGQVRRQLGPPGAAAAIARDVLQMASGSP